MSTHRSEVGGGNVRVTTNFDDGRSTDVTYDSHGIVDITDHSSDGSSRSYEGFSGLFGPVRTEEK